MSTIADLKPGQIGFGPIHGGAGALVNAGQLLLGEGFHVGKLDIRHVFVVTDVFAPEDWRSGLHVGGSVEAVEAMPSGARKVRFSANRWTPEYAYVQLPEDYPGQGEDAAAIARAMIGTPYSPLSYVALAAWRLGVHMPRLEAWIDRRELRPMPYAPTQAKPLAMNGTFVQGMEFPREAICSVLADQAWALTGKQVMPAGTPHQCVTPGALAQALLEMDSAKWLWPR